MTTTPAERTVLPGGPTARLAELLVALDTPRRPRVAADGSRIELPDELFDVLRDVVAPLSRCLAITALVRGYEPLGEAMATAVSNRRVLTAAVRAGADVIGTENVRDFPPRRANCSMSRSLIRTPFCSTWSISTPRRYDARSPGMSRGTAARLHGGRAPRRNGQQG